MLHRRFSFEEQEQVSEPSFFDYLSETLQMPCHLLQEMQHNNPTNFQKLVEKAKRTMRREKAKSRKQVPIEEPVTLKKRIKKPKEEEPDTDRKAVQMIRNRISAQNSRDRKKAYLVFLEDGTREQYNENVELKNRLEELRKQQNLLTQKNNRIEKQLQIVENVPSSSRIGKIGMALLTLISVFSLVGKNVNSIEPMKFEQPVMDLGMMSTPSSVALEKSFTMVDQNMFFEDKMIEPQMYMEEEEEYNYHLLSPPRYIDSSLQSS